MNTPKSFVAPTIIHLADWSARAGRRSLPLEILDEGRAGSRERLLDAKTQDAITAPGFTAAFDPDEAESMGAFAETALTEEDAIESAPDLLHGCL
jgi:hypothetical protein